MKDFRDNEILIGSTVIYAVKASTSCYIREGVVMNITDHPVWRVPSGPTPDCGREPAKVLHVRPTGRESNRWKKGVRPVRVTNLQNVVVVS